MKKIFISILLAVSFSSLKAQSNMSEDYWNDIDFNDSTLVSSKMLTNKIVSYLYLNSFDDDINHFDSLSKRGVDIILGKAKVNMSVYEFVLAFLLNGYTNMGKSQIVDYLLNYPQLFEGEISIAEGHRLDSISEPYQLVKVSAKAPDFSGVTIDGKDYHLYDSNVKHIIVMFWSTDCEYCHDFLVNVRKNLDLKSDYELVTFALAESPEEARKAVDKMRLPGYHFYGPLRWDSQAYLDYHVTSVPTVFLLDGEKTIVCKPYDWIELKLYINKNK